MTEIATPPRASMTRFTRLLLACAAIIGVLTLGFTVHSVTSAANAGHMDNAVVVLAAAPPVTAPETASPTAAGPGAENSAVAATAAALSTVAASTTAASTAAASDVAALTVGDATDCLNALALCLTLMLALGGALKLRAPAGHSTPRSARTPRVLHLTAGPVPARSGPPLSTLSILRV